MCHFLSSQHRCHSWKLHLVRSGCSIFDVFSRVESRSEGWFWRVLDSSIQWYTFHWHRTSQPITVYVPKLMYLNGFVSFWSAAGENFRILHSKKWIFVDFLPIWWDFLRMRMYKKIWFIFFYTFSLKILYKNIFFYTFFVKKNTVQYIRRRKYNLKSSATQHLNGRHGIIPLQNR